MEETRESKKAAKLILISGVKLTPFSEVISFKPKKKKKHAEIRKRRVE